MSAMDEVAAELIALSKRAISDVGRLESRIAALRAALAKWHCDACDGARRIFEPGNPGDSGFTAPKCDACDGTGLDQDAMRALRADDLEAGR